MGAVTRLTGIQGPFGGSVNDRLTGDNGKGRLYGLAEIGNSTGGGGAGCLDPGTVTGVIDGVVSPGGGPRAEVPASGRLSADAQARIASAQQRNTRGGYGRSKCAGPRACG